MSGLLESLRCAFESTLQADHTVRTEGEKFLHHFTETSRNAFETLGTLVVQLQDDVASFIVKNSVNSGVTLPPPLRQDLQKRMAVLAAVHVFLKNRVAKVWKYDAGQDPAGGVDVESDRQWLRDNLLQLINKAFHFCRRTASVDFSGVGLVVACNNSSCSGTLSNDSTPSNPDGLVATRDLASDYVKIKKELRNSFQLLAQMQEIARIVSRKDLPGPLEPLVEKQLLPILAAYSGVSTGVAAANIPGFSASSSNALLEVPELMSRNVSLQELQAVLDADENIGYLYASLILLGAMVRNWI